MTLAGLIGNPASDSTPIRKETGKD